MGMRKKLIDLLIAAQDLIILSRKADFLIANDVVPVVRCKDCIHTREKNGHEQFMYNENVCICTKEDIWGITKNEPVWGNDFCSYGERKDNEKCTDQHGEYGSCVSPVGRDFSTDSSGRGRLPN